MKQKDIVVIIVAVFISGIFSFFISNALFSSPQKRTTEVEVVEPISTDFKTPDPKYFNAQSIDPTKLIQIGNQDNQQPF